MANISFFLKFALVLFILSVLTLFIADKGTLEFKVTMVSAIISFLISAVCIWLIVKKDKY
jgi:hypothetical protein